MARYQTTFAAKVLESEFRKPSTDNHEIDFTSWLWHGDFLVVDLHPDWSRMIETVFLKELKSNLKISFIKIFIDYEDLKCRLTFVRILSMVIGRSVEKKTSEIPIAPREI